MGTEAIRQRIAKDLGTLQHDYSAARIGVFGSRVRGDARPDSDINLLVEFNAPIDLFEFVRLRGYLSRRLEARIDIVTESA